MMLHTTRKLATRVSNASREVVIVSAARTPIGSFNGAFAPLSGVQLGVAAVREAVARAGGVKAEETYLGNVISSGMAQAPTRQVVLGSGMGTGVPGMCRQTDKKEKRLIHTAATGVNKVCASGMKAVMLGASSIMLSHRTAVMTGGFESMSNVPHMLPPVRRGELRLGGGAVLDGIMHDGLVNVYDGRHMGLCAEGTAAKHGISREDQDAYAKASYERAAAAWASGAFADEVVAVDVPGRRGAVTTVAVDEDFTNVNVDKMPKLGAVFDRKNGTITAANASTLNDGAAALMLMSRARAEAEGLTPLASIIGFGDAAQEPEDFATAPALAVPRALAAAGVELADIGLHEINEAFSVVALANMQLLGLDHDKVNVAGGAVSIGHPIGSSGARIIITLVNQMRQRGVELGAASIWCVLFSRWVHRRA